MELKKQIKIENDLIIEKIKRGVPTYFLDNRKIDIITSILRKQHIKHNVFYAYEGATYGIIYNDDPNASLLEIKTTGRLRHQDILGSLFGLNIKNDVIGDIIINDSYYVVVLNHMKNYIINNIYDIGHNRVSIIESDFKYISNYKQKYDTYTITVSSLRIDTVVAKIVGTSRGNVIEKIKNKEIFLNYNILTKSDYILKEKDVFSVRRSGKYKFTNILGLSKRDKYIIEYVKYIN